MTREQQIERDLYWMAQDIKTAKADGDTVTVKLLQVERKKLLKERCELRAGHGA